MKIHEYQGKEIFRRYGIPVPEGKVAQSAKEAHDVADTLSGKMVVKAQIHAGGRGKGTLKDAPTVHGVKLVDSADAAFAHAKALLGHALCTHQTGPEGQVVRRVLVEAATEIAKEYYVGMTLDREHSRVAFIASTEGGMEIEKVAAETPDKILRLGVDPAGGFTAFHGRKLAYGLGLAGDTAKQAAKIMASLYQVFVETDASLVEINPLVVTKKGDVIALDAKVNFDDNALFRHPELAALRDVDEEDPRERAAKDAELSYVALDGNIGCLVNGAGLAMSTMDIIKYVGGEPANFLDVGGGATADQVTTAFTIILKDPKVRAILVNIFGGIAKCDVVATGVVQAAKNVGLKVPLVVRLEGTNVELGKKILAESKLAITPASDMLDAANKAVAAAGGAK
ncbi:MAG: ADP-forming succinate--CoA ligase subunit beta [Deltaproteobacteria bacterium]|nr:ADP-forming succinate--CoA ligase subunit beta [Deltaproteobacteria bacterium]